MNRFLFFLIFSIFISFGLFAQTGYYLNDSCAFHGVDLVKGTDYQNAHFCFVKKGDQTVKYTPDEITEYGFGLGSSYYSYTLSYNGTIQRVFLEKLVDGDIDLYYYKGKNFTLFLTKRDSSEYVIVPKYDEKKNMVFRDLVSKDTHNCQKLEKQIPLVKYNKNQIAEYYKRLNNCDTRPFPFFKYGLTFAYRSSTIAFKPNTKENLAYGISSASDKGFNLGAFIDCPILLSDFSFRSEILFTQYNISKYHTFNNTDVDMLLKINSFQVPLLIQYSIPTQKVRGFFNLGGIYQHHLQTKYSFLTANINGNIIEVDINDKLNFPSSFLGYVAGCGIQIKLDYRRWLFFEISKSHTYDMSNANSVNFEDFTIKTGLNF